MEKSKLYRKNAKKQMLCCMEKPEAQPGQYFYFAHLQFEWRISNMKIVSYQFINTV